ncbi:hypothetical protein [Streptomyces sp. HYC2]|uniref:hypothetical protein n=1 Tax=Streptomyces sp. HYC2 TaxID=2955207 RepID=UPI0024810166|nr:hypothetical protein [Streptomyces sp. HYC2]
MPADEVTHGTGVEESRVRTGPRHAAPKKPLFTRFHMPAGRAIAMAAMPTAVLMGMGFTSTHAVADNNAATPSAKSLTADEYKDCVAALDGSQDKASASPAPSASASAGDPEQDGEDATAHPAPSATSSTDPADQNGQGDQDGKGDEDSSHTSPSPDPASGDKAAPKPDSTASQSKPGGSGTGGAATAAPSASTGGGGLLGTIGDALGDVLTGGKQASADSGATPSASATPSAGGAGDAGDDAADTVKDTAQKVTDTVKDTVKDATGTVSGAAGEAGKAVEGVKDTAGEAVGDAAGSATDSPSPSASSTTDPENCPAATDAVGGVDNKVLLADDPWYLNASSLLLKGADYQGIVEVRTAGGHVKKVLKYVISDGTDIGDLHQTVKDKQAGKTYHVQAAKGSTSTIRGGDTVMYTESICGNLFGLLPVCFSPDSPPPLNIPLIYFTKVEVVQAAQFGGNLHVPGMHVYTTG